MDHSPAPFWPRRRQRAGRGPCRSSRRWPQSCRWSRERVRQAAEPDEHRDQVRPGPAGPPASIGVVGNDVARTKWLTIESTMNEPRLLDELGRLLRNAEDREAKLAF